MPKYNLHYFLKKEFSFVLIKNNKIICKSKSQGLKPLVFCFKKRKKEMRGAIVYDKVIGLAAAMLLEYSNVTEVWTPIISRAAKKYLCQKKVKLIYKKEVKDILNKEKNNLCGMEKLAANEGLAGLRSFFNF
jgi:hypothetical protein